MLYALANCSVKLEFRLSYTVSDPEAVKNELLGKAVTDAKEKAGVLMADECLTAPIAAGDASYDMDIEPDDIEVSDTVTMIWKIE